MRGNMFDDSFEVLKSLANELANVTPKTKTGAPRRVNPSSAERFHERLDNDKYFMANDMAEENLTPNAVVDQRMSMNPKPHPSDLIEQEEDRNVHPSVQIGHTISDAQSAQRNRSDNQFGTPLPQGPQIYDETMPMRDWPKFGTPYYKKSSPFEFAWTMLKEDVNYLHDAVESIQRIFGVSDDEAIRMVEQMHRHQLGEAGIPQAKIDREFSEDTPMGASNYLNNQFAKPMSLELNEMREGMDNSTQYQKYKDRNSRKIGERTSKEAITNRPRSSPRVPQMDEESSYANISIPRESPIHGIEPFGEDEPMGGTLPEPRRMSPLGESPMPQRSEDPPNPFKQDSPTSERLKEMVGQMNMPPKKPLELEGAGERAPIEFPQNLPMSQGPSRQQRRGMPGAGVSVKRPGFRGPPMPIGDDPMNDEGQIAVKEKRNFNPLPQEKNINTPEGTLDVARRMFGAGPPNLDDRLRRFFNEKRKTVLNEDVEGYPYNHPADGD